MRIKYICIVCTSILMLVACQTSSQLSWREKLQIAQDKAYAISPEMHLDELSISNKQTTLDAPSDIQIWASFTDGTTHESYSASFAYDSLFINIRKRDGRPSFSEKLHTQVDNLTIDPEQALIIARPEMQQFQQQYGSEWSQSAHLVPSDSPLTSHEHPLIWKVQYASINPYAIVVILIDAQTGEVLSVDEEKDL